MQGAEVFIVHLWGDPASSSGFRAAVQRTGTDESAWFTEPIALARYFEAWASARSGAKSGIGSHGPAEEMT